MGGKAPGATAGLSSSAPSTVGQANRGTHTIDVAGLLRFRATAARSPKTVTAPGHGWTTTALTAYDPVGVNHGKPSQTGLLHCRLGRCVLGAAADEAARGPSPADPRRLIGLEGFIGPGNEKYLRRKLETASARSHGARWSSSRSRVPAAGSIRAWRSRKCCATSTGPTPWPSSLTMPTAGRRSSPWAATRSSWRRRRSWATPAKSSRTKTRSSATCPKRSSAR